MFAEYPHAPELGETRRHLPRHVVVLGVISFLTAMSSAMVYGLLPVFLVRVLGATTASVGFIEGTADGMMSLTRILSGFASDWMGRRKPLVLIGYVVSAVNKLVFPLAGAVTTVLTARVIDRMGKGLRDAPRDAFMTDVTLAQIRGSGFGLRLAFYTIGYFIGPLVAMALMAASGDDFRLVFWFAVIPAALAIVILVFGIKETPLRRFAARPLRLRRSDFVQFTAPFWWAIAVASLLSLARFSHAFLILKAYSIGIDAAYVPIMMILMHLVYAVAAYPFGVPADRIDRRLQLMLGAGVLIGADLVLASATAAWLAMTRRAVGLANGHHTGPARGFSCRCRAGRPARHRLRHLRSGGRRRDFRRQRGHRRALEPRRAGMGVRPQRADRNCGDCRVVDVAAIACGRSTRISRRTDIAPCSPPAERAVPASQLRMSPILYRLGSSWR